MGILDALRKPDRTKWFVCHNCLMQTGHNEVKSIFYYAGPPTVEMGRTSYPCPRCRSTNTASFQQLKDEQSEAPLWGLEQIVRKHPRSTFEVKPEGTRTAK